jgi:hypothetical protein
MRYANTTEVSADRSRSEIERTLQRYGATSFAYGWEGDAAVIVFSMKSRRIQFRLKMPPRSDFEKSPGGRRKRDASKQLAAWEQATRQRWRALSLLILAKLEAVESGIQTFENEFLGATMLPDGSTVGTWIAPQIDTVYASGKMPRCLPLWQS